MKLFLTILSKIEPLFSLILFPFLIAPVLVVFCCYNTTLAKTNWGRRGLICLTHPSHSGSLREVRAEPQAGQRQGPWRKAAHWLAPHTLLGLLLYNRGLPAHSRLGPLTSIQKRKKKCGQAHLMEEISQLRFSRPR